MATDIETHRDLLDKLRAAAGTNDGTFEKAAIQAFEHVFAHLNRLGSGEPGGLSRAEDAPAKPDSPPPYR
ncbi:hypothetical protein [Methylobacterium nigriterrae]|uniref:hypothetical protein n=1 Tax=Methylobacterium nigriterrae TaxID=3127512 RepID=UPI003013A46B